ncbi:MAG: hypothetical protein RIS88_1413 [Pseudomonadota bacterium]|jgi:uncharacterized protein (DUF1330 family)
MPAYVINDMVVTDPVLFEDYKKLSPPTVAQYGGRFLARGGRIELLEGEREPKRLVVIEFPDAARARAWLESPEYAPARALRQKASVSNVLVVEGVSPG